MTARTAHTDGVGVIKRRSLPDWCTAGLGKMATLPVTSLAILVTWSLVAGNLGAETFAAASLLVTLPLLAPMLDFGLGAAVTTVVATLGVSSETTRVTWRRVQKILRSVAVLCAGMAVVLGLTGAWGAILGLPYIPGIDAAATAAVILTAAMLPLNVGYRVLLGMGRQTMVVFLQASAPLLSLVILLVIHRLGFTTLATVVICILAGYVVSAGAAYMVARREVPEQSRSPALDQNRSLATAQLRKMSVPAFAISLCIPVAYQTDRLILAHRSDPLELADYAAASMLYAPLIGVVISAGMALWPVFAGARFRNEDIALVRMTVMFSVAGGMCALALGMLGPRVAKLVVGTAVDVDAQLFWLFALFLLVQSIHYPSGMVLTDVWGMRFQAVNCLLMTASNIILSYIWSPALGSAGPVLASTVSVSAFIAVPNMVAAQVRKRNSPQRRFPADDRAPHAAGVSV
jgi:O-antigen/teichoic acid export membrane protein